VGPEKLVSVPVTLDDWVELAQWRGTISEALRNVRETLERIEEGAAGKVDLDASLIRLREVIVDLGKLSETVQHLQNEQSTLAERVRWVATWRGAIAGAIPAVVALIIILITNWDKLFGG
jgi:hypothetical protein